MNLTNCGKHFLLNAKALNMPERLLDGVSQTVELLVA
jgi:hypothetical protein